MILIDFLNRLKYEYGTLDRLTADTYYGRLSSIFVLLELDGARLDAEYGLGLEKLLDRMGDINEDELENGLSADQLKALIHKVKLGLGLIINTIEQE
ncbi:hypothetical protein [Mucilaginibacter glaciei]|uniref:Uncharacterized protein n=1 Tax=Mucilaginibacter glaciei TaxID=2772109 RepID=A0A926NPN4_9SPHI|nr:hypothetical protein [Mucilaginibacter glaciei]MBD1392345.1 hypothetical protein [Mucilaginibacter glaciei]